MTAAEDPDFAAEPRAAGATPHRVVLGLGLALTALVFSGTLRFAFIYDDWPQIVGNPAVQAWRYVPGYFIHHIWSHIYPTWPGNYYRPLFLIWLRLNHALFGLQPLGWHLTTVLAHLGVTTMVYWLGRRITGDRVIGAMAALLFGLHPAHIETVAWVSGVSEPLLALLFIPAFVFYLDAREQAEHRGRRMALSLICYVGALLLKETAIVLPGLVFGYEWLNGSANHEGHAGHTKDTMERPGARWARALRQSAPYLALSLAYLGVRQVVLKSLVHPEGTAGPLQVVMTWPSLVWFYLRHLAVPAPMSLFYDVGYVFQPTLGNFWLPLAATLVVAAGLWRWGRRSRAAALAGMWLALPLAPPLISIAVFGNGEIVHDRYLYLPSIGFVILVALALARIPASRAELFGLPASRIVAAFGLAGVLAVMTSMQSIHWASNLLLYDYGVQQAPQNALARIHLATEMLWPRTEMLRSDPTSAIRLYHEARDLAPNMWQANFVLGFAYFQLGHAPEAEQYLRDAIRILPRNPNQFLYLSRALLQQNRPEEAEAAARHAVELYPYGPEFHYAVGMALEKRGQLAAARQEYAAELKNDPTSGAGQKMAEIDKRLRGSTK